MISDRQARKVIELMQTEPTKAIAAAKAGMSERTARKWARLGKLPSEVKIPHTWRTREDPFERVWDRIRPMFEVNPGLEAKTVFQYLQREEPGVFADSQIRTLQRRVKKWRALEGPGQEIFFPQLYRRGELSESDFTHMESLGVTLAGCRFDHLIYHFVLPYSNWETGTICFSESFESLSEGLQNALWELGGVPAEHRTDRLTAAVHKIHCLEEFTARYNALLRHYGLTGKKTNAESPHENGDIEQRHYRFKKALDQELMLRGSRDFANRLEYAEFLKALLRRLNAGRAGRLAEELAVLRSLPPQRLEAMKRERARVSLASTIRVNHNTYSVNSRLIGEQVEIHLHSEHLHVYYGGQTVETMPRLRGENGHLIQYRHIIDWLVKKPGAFENYRYRDALFPTHRFRMAYDHLREQSVTERSAAKAYLAILQLAAHTSEGAVDRALEHLLAHARLVSVEALSQEIASEEAGHHTLRRDAIIIPVDLSVYDRLLMLPAREEVASV
jgi:Mu transposase, C-terminal domain